MVLDSLIVATALASVAHLDQINAGELLSGIRAKIAEKSVGTDSVEICDGIALIEVRGPNGQLKERRIGGNVICTSGKDKVLASSAGTLPAAFKYLAVGTSGTTPTAADTALGAQVAISSAITPTFASHILQFQYTFAAGVATGALQECGLFDAASAGTILSHLTFSTINVAAADSIQITYQLS